MRKSRIDRYATNQNAAELVQWLKARQEFVASRLAIDNYEDFVTWLDAQVEKTQRNHSAAALQKLVHKDLPSFIGNEQEWPKIKALFRQSQFDRKRPKLSLHKDDLIALRNAQKAFNYESLSETVYELSENALLLAKNSGVLKAFQSIECRLIGDNFGLVLLTMHDAEPLPHEFTDYLPTHARQELRAATTALYTALVALSPTSKVALDLLCEAGLNEDTFITNHLIEQLTYRDGRVYLGTRGLAYLVKDFTAGGVLSFSFTPFSWLTESD